MSSILTIAVPLALANTNVAYEVTLTDPATQIVDVSAVIEGAPPGDVDLALPEKFAFAGLPEPLLTGPVMVRGFDGNWTPIEREDPFRWRVQSTGDPIHLRWSVRHEFREQEVVRAANDTYEFPYVSDDHGLLVAGALLIAPDSPPESPAAHYSVRFVLPDGWSVHAPWPSEGDLYFPDGYRSLQDNLIAVGAWETSVIMAGGAEVTLAFAPSQELAKERVVHRIEPILKSAIRSFDHKPFERYLVLFGRADQPGFGGSPKSTSMTMSVNPDMLGPGAIGHVAHLVAHEFHHTWAISRYDSPTELRFFSEGFTDYYAYLLPARVGLSTPGHIASSVAAGLTAWENNPKASEYSLKTAGGHVFFEDPHALDLIYKGGLVIAALIDARLRADGLGNLDVFMQTLNNDPRWSKGGAAPGLLEFARALERQVGAAWAGQIMDWIETPGFPPATALLEAFEEAGVAISREQGPASLNLRANFDGSTITAIDPADVGFLLGLRRGDRLLQVNGRSASGAGSISSAWRTPIDGRVQVQYEREGEERVIDVETPIVVTYSVDPSRWEVEDSR